MAEFTGSMDDLRGEMEELRALVNTLLTIIMEEGWGPFWNRSTANPLPNPATQCSKGPIEQNPTTRNNLSS